MSEIKIYNQDCLEYMKTLADKSVDLIVTDPPYDIHVGIQGGSCSQHMGRSDRFKNENVGVATALNIGAEEAIKDGFKYLLTMDQDTSFNEGTLEALKEDLMNIDMSKIAILTPWHATKLEIDKPIKKYDLPDDVMTSANILNLDI